MDGSEQKLQEMDAKIDAIWKSVEKTRKNHLITMWITITFLVLPLLATVFVLPMFLNSYVGSLDAESFDSSTQEQIELLKGLLE